MSLFTADTHFVVSPSQEFHSPRHLRPGSLS
jgi:hypothetical protein